ncbi:MAG: NINE protein [Candidatus Saccharimonadaceae bacterium]
MQPETATTQPIKIKQFSKQRHFLAVFFISFMWGVFGVDRMYLGKWGTGILKLITLGGFGVWVIVDLWLIMAGTMRDKQGREMLQFLEYKSFANKTVLIFAAVLGIVILINGLALLFAIEQFINNAQNGTIPGLDSLNQMLQSAGGSGLTPEQSSELGL